jgi:myosin heavy subunit
MSYKVGEQVWAHTGSEACFELGKVERLDGHKGTIAIRFKTTSADVKEADVHKVNAAAQDGLPDNTYLRELNEATLLHNVRTRYNDQKDDGGCYSVTGHILIAVNPFRKLNIYEESNHKKYLSKAIGSEAPHIFAVADRMYRLLVSTGDSQAIIVSGPSGSGKTETCKYVLRHLAYVSKAIKAAQTSKTSEELGRLLVLTNPLLEAFGNAETTIACDSPLETSSRYMRSATAKMWGGCAPIGWLRYRLCIGSS